MQFVRSVPYQKNNVLTTEKSMSYQNSVDVLISRTARGEFAMVKINKEQARRLQLIRERIHHVRSQIEMAKKLGVEYARYNQWERGAQTMPAKPASRLKSITPGIDLDYIIDGDEGGLSVDALGKLKKCPSQ